MSMHSTSSAAQEHKTAYMVLFALVGRIEMNRIVGRDREARGMRAPSSILLPKTFLQRESKVANAPPTP